MGVEFSSLAGSYPQMFPLGWSVHATLGAILLAGFTGILVSLMMNPPATPGEHEKEDAFDDADGSV